LFLYYSRWKYGYFSPVDIHQNNYTNLITSTITIASLDCFPVIPLIRVKLLDHLGPMTDQPGEVVGHWNPTDGLKLISSIFNQSETYDIGGAVLNITAVVTFIIGNLQNRFSILKVTFRISF
jgi:hypothetical protein